MSTMPRAMTPPSFALIAALAGLAACDGGGETTPPPEPVFDEPAPAAEEDDAPVVYSTYGEGKIIGVASRADATNEPPAGSKMQLTVWDSDPTTLDTKVLLQTEMEISGGGPYAFEIPIAQDQFDETHNYGVSAMVVDDTGEAFFMSKPTQVMLVDQPPGPAGIKLDPASPAASSE